MHMTKRSRYLQFTRRTLMLAFAVFFLLSQGRVRATNHDTHIKEVMVGANGNSKIQFIVILQDFTGQNIWGPDPPFQGCGLTTESCAMLVFFDASGRETGRFRFPSNPPSPSGPPFFGSNIPTLIATQDFAKLPGAPVPDVMIPPLLNPIGGKVCFKSTPANTIFFRNECVSYGSFTGDTEGAGPAAPVLPIMNTVSLRATSERDLNSDFQLVTTPTPINTAGAAFTMPLAKQIDQGDMLFNNEQFLGNGRTCA